MSNTLIQGTEIPVDTETTLSMLETDPAAVYRRLRRETPIVRIKAIGRILVTKAEDVTRIKTDTEFFGSHDVTTPMQRAFGGHTLMRKDGCEHLRERRAMEPSLEPALLEQHWNARFEQLTIRQFDALGGKTAADLFPALAVPLAAGYLRLVLGIDGVNDRQLFDWAAALIRGAMNASFDPAVFAISDQANTEMNHCFDAMIKRHHLAPDCSVLSTMANQDDPIPLSQIRTNMKICIGGAVIETRDALLSTLYGLLSHPEQLRHCIAQNTWNDACEEGLRWVAPIQASPRLVKKPVVLRGVRLPEGETVMAVQASANHDEEIWDQPDQFDIHRKFVANQTFGEGPHECLGGGVYRLLVSKIVLPKLFARFPNLRLDDRMSVDFKGFAFRGPTSLPVLLT